TLVLKRALLAQPRQDADRRSGKRRIENQNAGYSWIRIARRHGIGGLGADIGTGEGAYLNRLTAGLWGGGLRIGGSGEKQKCGGEGKSEMPHGTHLSRRLVYGGRGFGGHSTPPGS